ncbi:hypothetical protein CAP36_11840 [Chitinophagaceae bacterium IBVUCB2]|nr:hypothetical protein CAP36_11840 [Chitinophagaceae bacterium IBVUCB2]
MDFDTGSHSGIRFPNASIAPTKAIIKNAGDKRLMIITTFGISKKPKIPCLTLISIVCYKVESVCRKYSASKQKNEPYQTHFYGTKFSV